MEFSLTITGRSEAELATLLGSFGGNLPAAVTTAPKVQTPKPSTAAKEAKPADAPAQTDPVAGNDSGEAKTYTFEDVREKAAGISQAGKTKQVKALMSTYDIKALSELPADKRTEFMAKLEAL